MPFPEKDSQAQKYTYQDYLTWSDEERWEIIDGIAYDMTPAPRIRHQRISRNLTGIMYSQRMKISPCELFEAPTDVVFDEYNVVQPDLFIICDGSKITEENIQGAPDLVIEITSPYTELKDRREKKGLYERFGVKEYIIVFPEREYVERYFLEQGKYSAPEIFNWDEVLKLKIFDIDISLWEVFEKQSPDTEDRSKGKI